jgi:hypothetical protein
LLGGHHNNKEELIMGRLDRDLEMGRDCYFGKRYYGIVGQHGAKHWVILDEQTNTAVKVHKQAVRPVAVQIFELGDRVESVFGGFTGTVVAFEEAENRVVCRSDNKKKDRQRFSYAVDEIVLMPKKPAFEVNMVTYVKFPNDPFLQTVLPLPHPDDATLITLYHQKTGKAMITLPAEITKADLVADFNIQM